jgi:peptide chain release factor 3
MAQLLKEGVAQSYELPDSPVRVPLLGAVGSLQFDVLQYRLQTEYGAQSRREAAPWSVARWIRPKNGAAPAKGEESARPNVRLPSGAILAKDYVGNWMVLLPSAWTARYLEESNPDLEVLTLPAKN